MTSAPSITTNTPMTPAPDVTPPEAVPSITPSKVEKSSQKLMTAQVYPVLSIAKLSSMDFAPPHDCNYFSWSPMKAYKARETGKVGAGCELETLHTYLTQKEYRATAADTLLEVNPFKLPNPNALITVYRVANSESGADFGAILPGAAVSECVSHAQWFADVGLVKNAQIFSTKVFPDELVTHGNPHDFIYVPRSVKAGFERYLADVKREQDSELARVRKNTSSLTGLAPALKASPQ
jgi:hypothetical protein